MEDVELVTLYEHDQEYEDMRSFYLSVIREIEKDYKKAVQPYFDRLAELENTRVPRYYLVRKRPDNGN